MTRSAPKRKPRPYFPDCPECPHYQFHSVSDCPCIRPNDVNHPWRLVRLFWRSYYWAFTLTLTGKGKK